jgi:hypothetical protein
MVCNKGDKFTSFRYREKNLRTGPFGTPFLIFLQTRRYTQKYEKDIPKTGLGAQQFVPLQRYLITKPRRDYDFF